MKALQKNQAAKIARLINDMDSARIMWNSAIEDNDHAKSRRWHLNWAQALVDLRDMGIVLPNYAAAQDLVNLENSFRDVI